MEDIILSEKKEKVLSVIPIYFDFLLFFFSLLLIFILKNEIENLWIIGFFIIFLSIYLIVKVRKNEMLFYLFAIIGFVNISIGISDCILNAQHVASWQMELRETENNVYTSKSILLFLSLVNLLLSYPWIKSTYTKQKFIKRKDNPLIAYIGTFCMYLILLVGYDYKALSGHSYVSNSNALIEYAAVIFAIVWFYSDKNKVVNYLIHFYAFLYVIISLSFGDRSASFLMILLYYLLFLKEKFKLSLVKVVLFSIVAVLLSNFIAEFRNASSFNFSELYQNTLKRGFYSDTVSYSYYAGITLITAHNIDNTHEYFVEYIKSWIIGKNSEYRNLTGFVREKYDLYNLDGGLYTSHFYFGWGFIGVVLGSILLALILRIVYSNNSSVIVLYQILIPVMSIRWYLYSPTSLYRSIFIISSLLIGITIIFNKISNYKKFYYSKRIILNSDKKNFKVNNH